MSIEPEAPACCVELNISVFDDHYLTSLLVDGTLQQRLTLQNALEVAEWTNEVLCTTGRDLYIHLRARGRVQKQAALELALTLSRQGLMIGFAEQPNICRMQQPGIQ